MTIVGKILVFLNLAFSVATSALIVVVFATRSNWQAEYARVAQLAQVGEAAYKAEKAAHDNDVRAKDELIASLQREREEMNKAVAAARAETKAIADQLSEAKKTNTEETATHQVLAKEVEGLRAERDQMAGEKAAREAAITRLQNEVGDNKKIAVQYEVAYKSALSRNEKLLTSYESVVKENNALKQFQGVPGGNGRIDSALTDRAPAPPPRDLRGQIVAVADSGLVSINIGSDSGLSVGNALDVYRLDLNNTMASLYLGRLKIRRVEAKSAVGQFEPASASREKLPKQGDEVSASVTGR